MIGLNVVELRKKGNKMNISAVNCTPIKPQVSFGYNSDVNERDNCSFNPEDLDMDSYQDNFEKIQTFTDRVNQDYIKRLSAKASNIKKPIFAAASVGLAALFAFASGKLAASKLAELSKSLKIDLPNVVDNSLRNTSKKMKDVSTALFKENPVTKFDKLRNGASKLVYGAEELAKKGYKRIAYSRVTPNDTAEIIKDKAFANLGGLLGLSTILPRVCSKDNNTNGVSDILEIGQNAYTGTKTKMTDVLKEVNNIGNLVTLLT